jgi:hypothetical protein
MQTSSCTEFFVPLVLAGLPFPWLDGKIVLFDWSRRWIKYADIVNSTFECDTVNTVRTDGRVERMPAFRLANITKFDVLEAGGYEYDRCAAGRRRLPLRRRVRRVSARPGTALHS